MTDSNPFVGTWKLISWEVTQPDGTIHYLYGKDVVGYLIYSADGYMSAEIMDPDRQQNASEFPARNWGCPEPSGTGSGAGVQHLYILLRSLHSTDLGKAEEVLRESENRYRAIFENTGTAIIIVEDDSTISIANTELEKLTGYTREEIENKKSWTEFVVEEDLDGMLSQHRLRRVDAATARKQYEFRLVDRHGQIKDISLLGFQWLTEL